MALLLQVGNIKIADGGRIASELGCRDQGKAIVKSPLGQVRTFPVSTRLIVVDNLAIVKEPGMPDSQFELPVMGRLLENGVYNLENQPRRFLTLVPQKHSTTLQAMIGREVRYYTAVTQKEPVTHHQYTFTGGGVSPQTKACVNGYPVEDWTANKRYYVLSVSSMLNDSGGGIQVTEMRLKNGAAGAIYCEITGLTINVPDGDTIEYTWTHSIYEHAVKTGLQKDAVAKMANLLFYTFVSGSSIPVATVAVYDGSTQRMAPMSVSYDPATGQADYSSTYTDWYVHGVTNPGANFTYDSYRVYNSDATLYAIIPITPGTWNSGAVKDIDFKLTWSDKP